MLLAAVCLPVCGPAPGQDRPGPPNQELERLFSLPDDSRFDPIAVVLLVSAQYERDCAHRRVDLDSVNRQLDSMAWDLKMRLRGITDPLHRVQTVCRYLYDERKFSFIAKKPKNQAPEAILFPEVLANRRGNCLGMSMVGMALMRRVGLPVAGVVAPIHFFLRYTDRGRHIDIEMSQRGVLCLDSTYAGKLPDPSRPGLYLQTLTARQTAAIYVCVAGALYLRSGNLARALELCELGIRFVPGFPEGQVYLAQTLERLHRYREAAGRMDLAIQLDSRDAQLYDMKGQIELEQGNDAQAVAACRRAVELDPRCLNAWMSLGYGLFRLGRFDEAAAAYARVLVADPGKAKAWQSLVAVEMRRKRFVNAVKYAEKWAALSPSNAEAWKTAAKIRIKQKEWPRALELLKTARELAPGDAEVWILSAAACQGLRDFPGALAFGRKACELAPDDEKTGCFMASLYAEAGKSGEAIRTCQQVLARHARCAEAWHLLGIVWIRTGREDLAWKAINRSLEHSPDPAGDYNNLGVICVRRGDMAGAAAQFKKALETEPDNATANLNLARVCRATRQVKQAREYLRRAKAAGAAVPEDLAGLSSP